MGPSFITCPFIHVIWTMQFNEPQVYLLSSSFPLLVVFPNFCRPGRECLAYLSNAQSPKVKSSSQTRVKGFLSGTLEAFIEIHLIVTHFFMLSFCVLYFYYPFNRHFLYAHHHCIKHQVVFVTLLLTVSLWPLLVAAVYCYVSTYPLQYLLSLPWRHGSGREYKRLKSKILFLPCPYERRMDFFAGFC